MTRLILATSAFALIASGALIAQDPPEGPGPGQQDHPLPPVPPEQPSDQEPMEPGQPDQDRPGEKKQDGMPMEMPKPTKEHEKLQQLVGEWEATGEAMMGPGEAKMEIKGTSSMKSLGGFWIVAEHKGDMKDKQFTGIQTLGYDAEKGKYVATWVDNMNAHLWTYEGTMEGDKVLKFTTEGPCPQLGGKVVKMEETIEVKDKDNLVYTTKIEDGGQFKTVMTLNLKRKA